MDLKQYRSKLIGNDDERAVSPVIGVILMVAITVILAAVIAAFVLDMGPGSESVNAAVTISGDETSTVTIEVTDGGNADEIVLVDDSGGIEYVPGDANTGASYDVTDTEVSSTGTEYDVYAIKGSLTTSDTLDDAEAQVEVGSLTVS